MQLGPIYNVLTKQRMFTKDLEFVFLEKRTLVLRPTKAGQYVQLVNLFLAAKLMSHCLKSQITSRQVTH